VRLTVNTPLQVVVDIDGVTRLRAEDATGSFGILPGHADFLTVLAPSVVVWQGADERAHYLAVRGGVLSVQGGGAISIATREAVGGEDLPQLEARVLEQFRHDAELERTARTDAWKLQVAAVREICRLLRADRPPAAPGPLPRS
jgi:F-type H+-transporting ATPase subunit epsilon